MWRQLVLGKGKIALSRARVNAGQEVAIQITNGVEAIPASVNELITLTTTIDDGGSGLGSSDVRGIAPRQSFLLAH
jgi:hypothetical protein